MKMLTGVLKENDIAEHAGEKQIREDTQNTAQEHRKFQQPAAAIEPHFLYPKTEGLYVSIYYQDDHVTLYHGDCLEITDWLQADVLVTDPPYGISYQSGGMSNALVPAKTKITADDTIDIRDKAIELWGDKPAMVFGSWRQPRPASTRHRLIWHKGKALPGMRATPWYGADEEIYILGTGFTGKPEQNVFRTETRQDGANGLVAQIGHPTPKPLPLMEWLIKKTPDGVIADPFAGSGSTLVAARNLGRKAIGVELEEKYCEIIANRLSQQAFDFA